MIDTIIYYFGAAVLIVLTLGAIGLAGLVFYARLLHDRFELIFFRRGEQKLSIASWHSSTLDRNGKTFKADDWPICDRPFYLSYRIGTKRYFILLGLLLKHRPSVIEGEHP